jgi:hypothetical protein
VPIGEHVVKTCLIYQHSRHVNLETLLMLRISSGIFGKIPHSWKVFPTMYQFNWWVDLIGNCHYFIYKLKNSNCNIVVDHIWLKLFWWKRGFSTSVFEIWWICAIIISLECFSIGGNHKLQVKNKLQNKKNHCKRKNIFEIIA